MNPNQLSNLSTLAKVGAATFCGAFFASLTLTTIPTTLDGWKMLVMPALAAAIASELVFLRAQIAAYLSGNPLGTPPPPVVVPVPVAVPSVAPSPLAPTAPSVVSKLPGALVVLLVGGLALGHLTTACTPAQVAAEQAVFSAIQTACQAEVLASSVIPAGTSAAAVANDVASACGLASTLLPSVEAVVTAWMQGQSAAGTLPPAGSVYKPSPMVRLKKPGPTAATVIPLDRMRARYAPSWRRAA